MAVTSGPHWAPLLSTGEMCVTWSWRLFMTHHWISPSQWNLHGYNCPSRKNNIFVYRYFKNWIVFFPWDFLLKAVIIFCWFSLSYCGCFKRFSSLHFRTVFGNIFCSGPFWWALSMKEFIWKPPLCWSVSFLLKWSPSQRDGCMLHSNVVRSEFDGQSYDVKRCFKMISRIEGLQW